MNHELMSLPYAKEALDPFISQETLEYHHGKHHATYVKKLNDLIAGTQHENQSLEDIIRTAEGGVFNNAAQVFNHSFYWHCLTPKGGGGALGGLKAAIDSRFGSFDQFKEEFTEKSVSLFGSGWTWLVADANKQLSIVQAANAGCPLTQDLVPILCCDVWEHAYYIDYRNARPKYLDAFWNLVNWSFADRQFAG